jgi:hypothetical protein
MSLDSIEFWTKGDEQVNFGDYVGIYFFHKLFSRPKFAWEIGLEGDCRPSMYRFGGSVIDDYHLDGDRAKYINSAKDRLVYWACGAREFSKPVSPALAQVVFLGVRGHHTRRILNLSEETVIGDNALALPLAFRPEKYLAEGSGDHVLLVPHALDNRPRPDMIVATGAEQVLEPLIEPTAAAVEDFIRTICAARFVLAGALHAAIVACAYDIPFAFWDSGAAVDVPFKWFDFASSINIGTYFVRTSEEGGIVYDTLIKPTLRKPSLEAILRGAPFVLNSETQPLTDCQTDRERYDVCVLGTSNAVMRDGYISQIAMEPTVRSLVNLSVGGSSSNLFTYRRPDLDAGGCQVVIVDFCVNDTTLYSSRFQNVRNIEQSLEEIICALNDQGRIPIILMLPLLFYHDNPVPDIYRDVAKRCQVPVFDGYKAIQAVCQATGLRYEELFEDPFHLRRGLSRCLGSWMMSSFHIYQQTLTADFDRQDRVSTTRYVPVSGVSRPSLPQVTRSTSLIGETFSEIDNQTTADLILPEDCSVVAVTADFANSHGVLCFSGSINLRICLSSLDLVESGNGLVLKAWPLPKAVFAHRGFIRINVVSEDEAGFDVSLHHPLSEGQKQMPPKISLAGLIVRDTVQTVYEYRSRLRNAELSDIDRHRFVSLAAEALFAEIPRPQAPSDS